MLMKRSYLMLTFAFFVSLFLLGSGLSASTMTITTNNVAVGSNNQFDFNNQPLSFSITSDEYTGTPATGVVSIYINSAFNQNVSLAFGNGVYSSPSGSPFTMAGIANGAVLKFEAYLNDTLVTSRTVTVNPLPPTFSNFVISPDTPVEGELVNLSIDVTDPSTIKDGSVNVHISVDANCKDSSGNPVSLTNTDRSLILKAGTTNTYQLLDYQMQYSCIYSLQFSADDSYENEGTYVPSNITVRKLAADSLNNLKSNYFVLAEDDIGFTLDASGATRFAQGMDYSFNLDADEYGIHEVKFKFDNTSDKKTVKSAELTVSSADFKSAEDLAYVDTLKSGFEVKLTGAPSGKICFKGDVKPVEKDVILYCSQDSVSACSGKWEMKQLDYATGCTKNSDPIGSYFILTTCNNDYWDSTDKVCETTLGGTGGSGSTSATDTTKKTEKTSSVEPFTSSSGSDGSGVEADSSTTSETDSEGGMLSGFGSFILDNKTTSIPIGVGIVLTLALGIFIAVRKGAIRSIKENLLKRKIENGKPSIHEIAKKHDVHKPTDPKDSKKLKEFVDVAMMMGHNPHDLADALRYRGWDPDTVESVFKHFNIDVSKE